jgi:hypothetical protein
MLTIRQQHTLYLSSVSKHALLVLGCANTAFIFIFLPARTCFFCVYSLPSVWLAIIFERSPQLNSYINYCFGGRQGGFTMGVMHIGAPACGMNAAVRSFVRNCIYRGDIVYGIHDGVEGLIEGNVSYPTEEKLEEKKTNFDTKMIMQCSCRQVQKMTWSEVSGWVGQGGAFLGTKRTLPEKHLSQVAAKLREFGIQGLLVIGGFEVNHKYQSQAQYGA